MQECLVLACATVPNLVAGFSW